MKRKFGIVLLILVLLLTAWSAASALPQQQEDPGTPLIIALYGDTNSTASYGMQLALEEIAALGPIVGSDGGRYSFQGLITDDPALLQGATAVLVLPESVAVEVSPPLTLDMPIFYLNSKGDLVLPGIGGTVFRGLTADEDLLAALASFSVNFNEAQRFALIGEGQADEFDTFEANLRAIAPPGEVTIIRLESAVPTQDELSALVVGSVQVVLYQGNVSDLNEVMRILNESGWSGVVVYEQAFESAQAGVISQFPAIQVVGLSPWVNSLDDPLSTAFIHSYLDLTGKAPDALAVSAYDVTWMMRLLVERYGSNVANILGAMPRMEPIVTTQGTISPAQYGDNKLFQSAVVYALRPLGGANVLARYDAGVLVLDEDIIEDVPTPTPTQTPLASGTPSQATATVNVNTLNVRSGPAPNYPVIHQVSRNTQLIVLGANPDYTWLYVQTPRGVGWVLTEYVVLFIPNGNITSIPQASIPPTPTPGPTFTPTVAVTPPDIVVENTVLNPVRPIIGQNVTATVTVRNNGTTAAGSFAVAASFDPGDVYAATTIPSLGAGQSTTITLNFVPSGASGTYTTGFVGDLNNEVAEANETNNIFDATYTADRVPAAASQGTYNAPTAVTFVGANPEFDWTGAALDGTPYAATLAVLPGNTFDNAHAGLLTSATINSNSIAIATGTIFGMRTNEGHCGVGRVDSLSGGTITITYRMYAPADCPA